MRRIKPFDYYKPHTLQEALTLLSQIGEEVKVLAGGTDLLVSMKVKGIAPSGIINIKGIEDLGGVSVSNGVIGIGALSTIHSLCPTSLDSPVPPILATACKSLGTPQVRSLATIGGNLCNASPAADLAPALLVLGAKLELVGPSGERFVPVDNFFLEPGKSAIKRNEILTRIEITFNRNSVGVYLKHGLRKAGDLAIVGVAVALWFEENSEKPNKARIALGAVAPTPIRAKRTEDLLIGCRLSRKVIRQAARAAMEESRPISDVRASAEYRKEIVEVLTERALGMALRSHRKNGAAKKKSPLPSHEN